MDSVYWVQQLLLRFGLMTSKGTVIKREDALFTHTWHWDWPWHMVRIKDWFYMVSVGKINNDYYLHLRILGIRSRWKISFFAGKLVYIQPTAPGE